MTDPIQYIHHLFVIKSRSPALIEAQKRYYEKVKEKKIKRILDRYNSDEEFRLKHIEAVRRCQIRKKNAERV
jgi:hypothetical protein